MEGANNRDLPKTKNARYRSPMPANNVSEHILRLALGVLKHSTYHAHLFSPDNELWEEVSVVQAAHAGELLIKARIAEEHPLLIFDRVPPARPDQLIDVELLAREGKTFQYADLPQRLWAATGIHLADLKLYQEFGRLRNSIQHFAAPPGLNCSVEALRYVFGVLDPLLHECWGLYAIDYNEDHEPYVYYIDALVRMGITFRPSPECVTHLKYCDLNWPSQEYRSEMELRFDKALHLSKS